MGVDLRLEQIPYFRNLAAAPAATSGARLIELAPFKCYIREIMIHWPDGCNALVDIAVWLNITQILPREGWLALNNATRSWRINRPAEDQDELTVVMRNGDGIWPHAITVVMEVEERL